MTVNCKITKVDNLSLPWDCTSDNGIDYEEFFNEGFAWDMFATVASGVFVGASFY